MKIFYFLLSFALIFSDLNAQITITSIDMPSDNEDYLVSNSFDLSFDPEASGADYSWDFSDLVSFSQDTISFVGIGSMPFIFQIIFNNPFDPNFQASEARNFNNLDLIPQLPIESAFLFTKTSSTALEELGYGVSLGGLDLPIQYSDKKTIYEFPLNFGDSGNDDYAFSIAVPGLGYLGESGNQSYEVDGWGTLTTSFGTFDVLRTKIQQSYEDTIYVDSNEFGITIPRDLIIYEWLGENTGIPLLQITTEFGLVTSVVYQDSLQIATGISRIEPASNDFILYPQPAINNVSIAFENVPKSDVNISIYDLSGKLVFKENYSSQKIIQVLTSTLNSGLYMLEVEADQSSKVEKLIIR